jgi:hypothetical protein
MKILEAGPPALQLALGQVGMMLMSAIHPEHGKAYGCTFGQCMHSVWVPLVMAHATVAAQNNVTASF